MQYGWRVGIPEAGQLNALETINIRGERSNTCKGDFDRKVSDGPLPAGAPAECEEFTKATRTRWERAAELDKQYGRNPDLKQMPLYCTVFELKDWYDVLDIRSTGGNDVNYAMDAPKVDSPDVAAAREKGGAIIYAVPTASNVPMASASGPNKPTVYFPGDRSAIFSAGAAGLPIRTTQHTHTAWNQQRVGRCDIRQPCHLRHLRADEAHPVKDRRRETESLRS